MPLSETLAKVIGGGKAYFETPLSGTTLPEPLSNALGSKIIYYWCDGKDNDVMITSGFIKVSGFKRVYPEDFTTTDNAVWHVIKLMDCQIIKLNMA